LQRKFGRGQGPARIDAASWRAARWRGQVPQRPGRARSAARRSCAAWSWLPWGGGWAAVGVGQASVRASAALGRVPTRGV